MMSTFEIGSFSQTHVSKAVENGAVFIIRV